MYGLKDKTVRQLKSIFNDQQDIEKVVLYGSRAKGNFREGSDIDLTVFGKNLSLKTIYNVEEKIEELLLAYHIDLSIYDQIDNPDLIEHIERVGQIFYERKIIES